MTVNRYAKVVIWELDQLNTSPHLWTLKAPNRTREESDRLKGSWSVLSSETGSRITQGQSTRFQKPCS
jgi:hypothetical protein